MTWSRFQGFQVIIEHDINGMRFIFSLMENNHLVQYVYEIVMDYNRYTMAMSVIQKQNHLRPAAFVVG